MNVLIVEDDDNKRSKIHSVVATRLPDVRIMTARSVQSGLRVVVTERIGLLIVDMTLPTFDLGSDESGGRPRRYGGRELLEQMELRSAPVPTIVVTQFDVFGQGRDALTLDELDGQLMRQFPAFYRGSVHYDPTQESWKDALVRHLEASSDHGG